ncbi:MAG TPA: tat (twin-arginine translocation) pathway signal sequence [Gammaproteobacteria bacterium]
MSQNGIDRRGFLKTSGTMIIGTLAASSGTLALLAPTRTWALELKVMDADTGAAVLKVTRHIFPHDKLDDAVYALVVKDLDAEGAETAALLKSGVASLNQAAGGRWLDLPEAKQAELVAAMEKTPFFQKIRGKSVVSLYNNEMAFAHFGYPGESASKGGYLRRGFQDLSWLPNPPASASPAAM